MDRSGVTGGTYHGKEISWEDQDGVHDKIELQGRRDCRRETDEKTIQERRVNGSQQSAEGKTLTR